MRNIAYAYCLNICLFFHVCQSHVIPLQPRQASKNTSSPITTTNALVSRKVHVVTILDTQKRGVSQQTGAIFYGGHAYIRIDGTESDGPLLIELGFSPVNNPFARPPDPSYAIRFSDRGAAHTGERIKPHPSPHSLRYDGTPGETLLTNADLFDHETGRGLVADAWMENPVYTMGTNSSTNTCYDLIVRVLRRMNLDLDPVTKTLFDDSTVYYTSYSRKMVQRVPFVASYATQPKSWIKTLVWNVDYELNPHAPSLFPVPKPYSSNRPGSSAGEHQLGWGTGGNVSIW